MKDYLFIQLRELPYFRAALRAVEASFYEDLPLPGPVLDVGCGDGHFAARTFDRPAQFRCADPAALAREYDPDTVAEKYEFLFEELLKRKGRILPAPQVK